MIDRVLTPEEQAEAEARIRELTSKKMKAEATINGRSYNTETAKFVFRAIMSGWNPSDRDYHAAELYRINAEQDDEEFFLVHDYGKRKKRKKDTSPIIEPISREEAEDWGLDWMLESAYKKEFKPEARVINGKTVYIYNYRYRPNWQIVGINHYVYSLQ